MAKMGNTKYMTADWGELSAKAIITKLKAKKEVKYSRHYRCHYAEIEVVLGKRAVKLFFCRRGKKEGSILFRVGKNYSLRISHMN